MWSIAVASANPAKITAVEQCFSQVFPGKITNVRGYSCESGVRAQPISAEETLLGAHNRIADLKNQVEADFYVAIEAGLDGDMTFAWMVIQHGTQVVYNYHRKHWRY